MPARLPHLRNDPGWRRLLELALAEDLGAGGDVTSRALIPENATARFVFRNRSPLVVAGLFVAEDVLGSAAGITLHAADGQFLASPQALITVEGNARALLAAERVMLNLLQRACGVATLTRDYVEAVEGTGVQILDTRKTMPGLRLLDKYAVTCGGGVNHRLRLDDRILIKDNHIAVVGSVSEAVRRAKEIFGFINPSKCEAAEPEGGAKRWGQRPLIIEIECDTITQVEEAAACGVDWILLDNMKPAQLREAVRIVAGRAKLEASGGVTLATVRAIAETGVCAVSVGALTHSAPAADIGLDILVKPR